MAAGDIAALNNAQDIQTLLAALNAIRPAGGYTQTTGPQTVTTSDRTQTTEEIASPEAVQALVKQMLEGTSGLAAISSGQKNAGMYNSTTNSMLTNDLMSRVAAAGAALNKKQVTTVSGGTQTTSGTTTEKVMTPQISEGDLAKLMAGLAAASALKNASKNDPKNGQSKSQEDNKKNKRNGAPEAADIFLGDGNGLDNIYDKLLVTDRNAIDGFLNQTMGMSTQHMTQSMNVLQDAGALQNPVVESIMNSGNFLRMDDSGRLINQTVTPFGQVNQNNFGQNLDSFQLADIIGNSGAKLDGSFENISNADGSYSLDLSSLYETDFGTGDTGALGSNFDYVGYTGSEGYGAGIPDSGISLGVGDFSNSGAGQLGSIDFTNPYSGQFEVEWNGGSSGGYLAPDGWHNDDGSIRNLQPDLSWGDEGFWDSYLSGWGGSYDSWDASYDSYVSDGWYESGVYW